MSARRKKGSPMKYRGFYCDDTLYEEMQRCAEITDESDSEYIRKAIEMRNRQYNEPMYTAEETIKAMKGISGATEVTLRKAKKQEFKTFFKSK